MTQDWRYHKPPPRWQKAKAFFTLVFFLAFLGAVLFLLYASIFGDFSEETTTTRATTTTLATTTTVDGGLGESYCEGWYSGQAFGLVELGMTAEMAVETVASEQLPLCDTTNRYLSTPNEAWCEGFTEAFVDTLMPYTGPLPHGFAEQGIADCLAGEFYTEPVFQLGGGGPLPQDN